MFFEFGIKDIIDILLVAVMLYYSYRLMRESRSLNAFMGVLVFVIIWIFVSQILEMRLLGTILDKMVSVGVIGLVILFQEDIRHFLYNLGAHRGVSTRMKAAKKPRSRRAGASRGIKLAKAPTVVMLPMSNGETISFSTSRAVPPWSVWAMKCRG